MTPVGRMFDPDLFPVSIEITLNTATLILSFIWFSHLGVLRLGPHYLFFFGKLLIFKYIIVCTVTQVTLPPVQSNATRSLFTINSHLIGHAIDLVQHKSRDLSFSGGKSKENLSGCQHSHSKLSHITDVNHDVMTA